MKTTKFSFDHFLDRLERDDRISLYACYTPFDVSGEYVKAEDAWEVSDRLSKESEHSDFLERLVEALVGPEWETLTIFKAKEKREQAEALEAENARLRVALEAIGARCNLWAKGPAHDVRHDVALIARRALGKEA